MKKQVIFAGRFQPFHCGHMSVIQQALATLDPNDVLILAAVAQIGLDFPAVDPIFAQSAKEHHLPERNPWPLVVRLSALMEVAKVLKESSPERDIVVTAIPRPDYGWKQIQAWFLGPRVWLIPIAQEAFDDDKAAFFESMGDQVLRHTDESGVSGRELRDMWSNCKINKMKQYMPECVHNSYLNTKFE